MAVVDEADVVQLRLSNRRRRTVSQRNHQSQLVHPPQRVELHRLEPVPPRARQAVGELAVVEVKRCPRPLGLAVLRPAAVSPTGRETERSHRAF